MATKALSFGGIIADLQSARCYQCVGQPGAFGDELGEVGRDAVLVAAGGLAVRAGALSGAVLPKASDLIPKAKHFRAALVGSGLKQLFQNGDPRDWNYVDFAYDAAVGAFAGKFAGSVAKLNPAIKGKDLNWKQALKAIEWKNFGYQQALIIPSVSALSSVRSRILGKDPSRGQTNALLSSGLTGSPDASCGCYGWWSSGHRHF